MACLIARSHCMSHCTVSLHVSLHGPTPKFVTQLRRRLTRIFKRAPCIPLLQNNQWQTVNTVSNTYLMSRPWHTFTRDAFLANTTLPTVVPHSNKSYNQRHICSTPARCHILTTGSSTVPANTATVPLHRQCIFLHLLC